MKKPKQESIKEEVKMAKTDASKELLRFWNAQWEAYMKSMIALQSSQDPIRRSSMFSTS